MSNDQVSSRKSIHAFGNDLKQKTTFLNIQFDNNKRN